jgi:hypothetical protein
VHHNGSDAEITQLRVLLGHCEDLMRETRAENGAVLVVAILNGIDSAVAQIIDAQLLRETIKANELVHMVVEIIQEIHLEDFDLSLGRHGGEFDRYGGLRPGNIS